MTPVQACRACGRLAQHLPRGVCADCIDQRERDFRTVREWLRDHPGSSIRAASEATGVEERTIVALVREGRIDLVSGDGPTVEELREDEERRARLVRELASRPTLGTSVNATSPDRRGGGMLGRRG